MKLKITPLFLASIGVMIFGFFYIFYKMDSTLGPLAGIMVFLLGLLTLGLYFILRILMRNKVWLNILVEFVIIVTISFSCYKLTRKIQLIIPPGYKGDIVLVYNVYKQPKLKPSNFFLRNIDVEVPPSGIILIGNRFAPKYFNNLLIIDKYHSRVFEPGYGVTYTQDTLKCGYKKFNMEILHFEYSPNGAIPKPDTLERLRKLESACQALGLKY